MPAICSCKCVGWPKAWEGMNSIMSLYKGAAREAVQLLQHWELTQPHLFTSWPEIKSWSHAADAQDQQAITLKRQFPMPVLLVLSCSMRKQLFRAHAAQANRTNCGSQLFLILQACHNKLHVNQTVSRSLTFPQPPASCIPASAKERGSMPKVWLQHA